MKTLKPNHQRAKNAITLIWIVLVMEIISMISGYFQYDLLQTVSLGGAMSVETASANDTREAIIGIVYLIVYIISAITFIQWFRRAYFNLQLKAKYLSFSDGQAASSWFIPVVNLFRPFNILKELYIKTKELLFANKLDVADKFNTSSLGWWWALWIISAFLGQFVFRYSLKAETIDELTEVTIAGMISNIIGIPLALITIKIIRDYSNSEHLLVEIIGQDKATETIIDTE